MNALEYDIQLYSIPGDDEDARCWAPGRALRALMNEAVIFVYTNATAAGPMLQDLHLSVSAVIIDYAGHASENDKLMPIIACADGSQDGRLHVVLVGDHKQLSPLHLSRHDVVMFVSKNRDFHFRSGLRSNSSPCSHASTQGIGAW